MRQDPLIYVLADRIVKASTGGPRPAPTRKPRGGKYLSREWDGHKWVYTYPDDSTKTKRVRKPKADVPTKTVTRPRKVKADAAPAADAPVENTTPHIAPDTPHDAAIQAADKPGETYSVALAKAISEPGKTHALANPSGGEKLDIVLSARTGKFRVTNGKEKIKEFDSQGAFEKWYLGVAGTITFHDADGRPWLDVKPNVGNVRNGRLVPNTSRVGYFVEYHPTYPQEMRAKGDSRGKWRKVNLEDAERHVKKMLRDQQLARGIDVAVQERQLSDDDREALKDAKKRHCRVKPGSVADKIQSGKYGFRLNPETGQRELDVTPEEREKLVQQAAMEFFPAALRLATRFSGAQYYRQNRRAWMLRFLGVPELTERGSDGWDEEAARPKSFVLDDDSPVRAAINRAMDTYDPAMGAGFATYLAGPRGQLYVAMRSAAPRMRAEAKMNEGTTVVRDGSVQGLDPDSLIGLDGRDDDDFNHEVWEGEQERRLAAWQPKTERGKQFKQMVLTGFQEVKDSRMVDKQRNAEAFVSLLAQLSRRPELEFDYDKHAVDLGKSTMLRLALDALQKGQGSVSTHALDDGEPLAKSSTVASFPKVRQDHFPYINTTVSSDEAADDDPDYDDPLYPDDNIRRLPQLSGMLQELYSVAVGIQAYRAYVQQLAYQEHPKARATALGLLLLDQGRMRTVDICYQEDTRIEDGALVVGGRKVRLDDSALAFAGSMIGRGRPLLCVQVAERDSRALGPEYLEAVVELAGGFTITHLQSYHATMTYLRVFHSMLKTHKVSREQAASQALYAAALSWGHDFSDEKDPSGVLQAVRDCLVDGSLAHMLMASAVAYGVGNEAAGYVPDPAVPTPYVSFSTTTTPEEDALAGWLASWTAIG